MVTERRFHWKKVRTVSLKARFGMPPKRRRETLEPC